MSVHQSGFALCPKPAGDFCVSYIGRRFLAECFEPVAPQDARVLVLGSVPGEASIAAGRYYAHPRNAFWPLMEHLLGNGAPLEYRARVDLILSARIALWDVLASATRIGSLDSAIVPESEVPNDVAGFLDAHPSVASVFFNGAKAEESFRRHHRDLLTRPGIKAARLPSTSPANAAVTFQGKVAAWRVVTDAAGE